MAVTGSILVLFAIVHLLGNLQIYHGPDGMNAYARLLRVEPLLLWMVRLVLLTAAVLHIYFGVVLWLESRRARPVGYAYMRTVKASLASRTMIYSGIIVMGFIIYHLLHLTFGATGPAGYQFDHTNVYRNVVRGFSDPYISILYIVGQLLLSSTCPTGSRARSRVWVSGIRSTSPRWNAAAPCSRFFSPPATLRFRSRCSFTRSSRRSRSGGEAGVRRVHARGSGRVEAGGEGMRGRARKER